MDTGNVIKENLALGTADEADTDLAILANEVLENRYK